MVKDMKINKYPDGTSYVTIKQGGDYCYPSSYTFRLNTYEDLWHLNQLVDVCNNKGIKTTITIPNLIDAQADRRFAENQSSGLKLVCKFLNSMGAHFKIFHPHNPEVVEALLDNVEIITNESFIKDVLLKGLIKECPSILKNGINNDNLILMSSDAGGYKPLMKTCDKISWKGDTSSASKVRWADGRLTQIVPQDNYYGKDILIVDDICVYGGTFKGLAKLLRERNCGKLYLAVSHMTVQELGQDPVTDYFDKVFTTNSKFDKYYGRDDFEPKNLEIIELF